MDIRQLRYFLAISEARSISAASQAVGVAQPSLSQHIRRMEDELGVQLVERSPRGTILTEEGRVLAEHARHICDSVDRCVADMHELNGVLRGRVSFGMPPSVSMVMSVPLAETVRHDMPEVRLRTVEAMSGYIKTWVQDGTVDIGFLYDLEGVEHFRRTHVLQEDLYFHSSPDAWPLDTPAGTPVPLRALERLDMVLTSNGLRHLIEKYCAANRVTLNVVVEMDAMTQIKELVARGSGYTILAPAAAQDFVARGELLRAPIVEPRMTRPVYLVTNPARAMTRACRAVEQLTLDVSRELVRRGIWEGRTI
ncbi:LysR family transcriptional regulator [Rhodovulum kholense]|uniref:LysR family nitrogen assimilation transcriptional regulator n=1 Tax=Rhodovulum kholense TaxID=453584 RepID=A0A8E2VH39_9RHOB|nr:LysR family transcriptional regulator [Rhodovulum kholense]PTW44515.1 LysR family nitrogen assimilation transcriptional regulator [Rhodovulum kholense]